jgi:hypothetical protein
MTRDSMSTCVKWYQFPIIGWFHASKFYFGLDYNNHNRVKRCNININAHRVCGVVESWGIELMDSHMVCSWCRVITMLHVYPYTTISLPLSYGIVCHCCLEHRSLHHMCQLVIARTMTSRSGFVERWLVYELTHVQSTQVDKSMFLDCSRRPVEWDKGNLYALLAHFFHIKMHPSSTVVDRCWSCKPIGYISSYSLHDTEYRFRNGGYAPINRCIWPFLFMSTF